MAYQKQTWRNLPDRTTPITAERLEHMETQYEEAIAEVGPEAINNKISTINNTLPLKADLVGGKVPASQISGTPGAGVNLVEKLRLPVYIAHRGALRVYPEHSWEAYRASYNAGFTPEADVRALADGTLVCIHDATSNRTMDISGNVSSQTVEQWRKAKIKPPVNDVRMWGTGWGTPVFFEDYLDEFGKKTVLFPEIKDPSFSTEIIQAVVDRGLQNSVVLQSGSFEVCEEIVNAGCYALLLTTNRDPEDLVSSGIQFVGTNLNASTSYITSCKSAGLRVIAWTANTKTEADSQLSRGCDGVFSDDPWKVSDEFTPQTSLDLTRGFIPPASTHAGDDPSKVDPGGEDQFVTVRNNSLHFSPDSVRSARNVVKLGLLGSDWGQGVLVNLQAYSAAPGETSGGNTWVFGIYLGSQGLGEPVNESPESKFLLAVARRNGIKNAWLKRTASSSTDTLGGTSAPSTPYSAVGGRGAPMDFAIRFSPTGLVIQNLTRNDTDLSVSYSSFSLQDLYLTIASNSESYISNITVSSL